MSTKTFRLTLVYASIWTVALMVLLFLHFIVMNQVRRAQAADLLRADWSTMKGYLKIERGKVNWYVDQDDADESVTVWRLRHAVTIADSRGNVIERGPSRGLDQAALRRIQETPANVTVETRESAGKSFLLLAGPVWNEDRTSQYYAFLERPIPSDERFLRLWLLLIVPAFGLSLVLSGLMVRHCQAAQG